jgi:hypothetical protein
MLGAVLCLAWGSARAEVVIKPGVPFTALQLEAAVAARGGTAGLDIEVSSPRPERVALVTSGGRWEIEIGAARGEAAARVVALHVVELAVDAAPVSAGVTRAPGEVAPAPEAGARASSRRAAGPRIATLAVGALGLRRSDFASLGGAIEVTYAGPWILGAGLSWQREQTYHVEYGPQITGDLFRGRAIGGASFGPVEVVVIGFAGRVRFNDVTGWNNRWSTGLGGDVRLVLPASGAWAAVIAMGIEAYGEVTEAWYPFMPVAAMPHTTVAAGIGIAWRGGTSR